MIRRVQKLREFGSIHSLFCDDDDKKREKNEREKRRTNASEPRQSHVRRRRRRRRRLLVVVSGQRLSNMRDRMFFFCNDDSQGGAFSKRPNIIYSRPRDAFCTALVDPTHSISSSKILSLFFSLSLERDKNKKKIVLVNQVGCRYPK